MSTLSPFIGQHSVDLAARYRLSIVPQYARHDAVIVNLDNLARELRCREGASPLLHAGLTDRFLRRLHRRWNVGYSFGGYVEDRRELWRGSYLDETSALHLGIDVNLPASTQLSVAQPATLVRHEQDIDQQGGWGGVSFFQLDQPLTHDKAAPVTHFLYAHLKRGGPALPVGTHVTPGDVVAVLGPATDNGGWYEHLHVQALTQEAWDQTQGILQNFDGYAPVAYSGGHPLFPDPWALLGARKTSA